MNPAPKPPPSLDEARARLDEQYFKVMRRSTYGSKIGRKAEWEIWELGRSAKGGRTADLMAGLEPGGCRRVRIAQLGEWLERVILSENAGQSLRHLASCINAKPSPKNQAASGDFRFIRALSWFLRDPDEFAPEKPPAVVPTLAQLRRKLGWSHETNRKAANRLGWRDLPQEPRHGRPPKVSPAKSRKR